MKRTSKRCLFFAKPMRTASRLVDPVLERLRHPNFRTQMTWHWSPLDSQWVWDAIGYPLDSKPEPSYHHHAFFLFVCLILSTPKSVCVCVCVRYTSNPQPKPQASSLSIFPSLFSHSYLVSFSQLNYRDNSFRIFIVQPLWKRNQVES